MQMIPVPLFDKDMAAKAYLFRYQKDTPLPPVAQAAGMFDGANQSPLLEALNRIGLEAYTLGKQIFVPIKYIMLLSGLDRQCSQPPEKVVFLLDDMPPSMEPYLAEMHRLKAKGFRFAVRYLPQVDKYMDIIRQADYCFLSQRDAAFVESARQLKKELKGCCRHLRFVATRVHSEELYRELAGAGYDLCETKFCKAPGARGPNGPRPLEASVRRLQSLVREDNFELKEVTGIVRGDPALAVSLLKRVGDSQYQTRARIKSISHAVAMLGQGEIQKWANATAARTPTTEGCDEITRISLLRAKFAENLAEAFHMASLSGELFLMGMLSVIDVMLEQPINDALGPVQVSEHIEKALLEQSGPFGPVLRFVAAYEGANWSSVSRQMILLDLSDQDLSAAFFDALTWFRGLLERQSL